MTDCPMIVLSTWINSYSGEQQMAAPDPTQIGLPDGEYLLVPKDKIVESWCDGGVFISLEQANTLGVGRVGLFLIEEAPYDEEDTDD
jgi:hypothetical protein